MELYYHDTDGDVLILTADGGINGQIAEEMVEELGRLIESGAGKLIVDCSQLSVISSYGVSILLRMHAKLALKGGDVKLAGLPSRVMSVLRLTRLDTVFQVYPTLEGARLAFKSQA